MVSIWNIQGNNAFLQALCRESFFKFFYLEVFHYANSVCPIYFRFANGCFIIEPCRFCFKLVFEQFFSCFASVLVLVADEEHAHSSLILCANINLLEVD